MVAMMNRTKNILAVPDAKSESAGAIVFWCNSGEHEHAHFARAIAEQGLPEKMVPELPSSTVALRRAVRSIEVKGTIARSIGPAAWAIIGETVIAADGEHPIWQGSQQLRAALNDDETLWFDPPSHPMQPRIEQDFARFRSILNAEDLSVWLIELTRDLHALQLRQHGGVYFVPQHRIDIWKQATFALSAATSGACWVGEIPAMPSREAIVTLTRAMATEARELAAGIEAEVAKGKLGLKALTSRTDALAQMEEKIGAYENLLAVPMNDLRASLDTVSAVVAATILAKEAELAAEAAK